MRDSLNLRLAQITPNNEFIFPINSQGNCTPIEIQIKNVANRNITFKIKTTEPKSYTVKPNQGVVGIGDQEKVTISLSPVPSSTANHKFMIQVSETELTGSAEDASKVETFWRTTYKELPKDWIENHKIKVSLQGQDLTQSINVPLSQSVVSDTLNQSEIA